MNVNSPIRAWQVWEDKPFSIVEDYVKVPPSLELLNDPEDGWIVGNRFRIEDVVDRYTGHIYKCWVPGTRFKNLKTGKIFEVYTHYKNVLRKRGAYKIKQNKWKEIKPSDQLELKGL